MTARLALLLLAVGFAPSVAHPQQSPARAAAKGGFRGVQWGADADTVKEALNLGEPCASEWGPGVTCVADTKLGLRDCAMKYVGGTLGPGMMVEIRWLEPDSAYEVPGQEWAKYRDGPEDEVEILMVGGEFRGARLRVDEGSLPSVRARLTRELRPGPRYEIRRRFFDGDPIRSRCEVWTSKERVVLLERFHQVNRGYSDVVLTSMEVFDPGYLKSVRASIDAHHKAARAKARQESRRKTNRAEKDASRF